MDDTPALLHVHDVQSLWSFMWQENTLLVSKLVQSTAQVMSWTSHQRIRASLQASWDRQLVTDVECSKHPCAAEMEQAAC